MIHKTALKTSAIFMIYLVFTIMVFQSVAAQATVTPVSGDLNVNIPLINMPGVAGFDYGFSLSYTGGDGILMGAEAGWVGLGWNLVAGGSVSRSVIGIPDDAISYDVDGNTIDTVYMYHYTDTDDTRTFWEKLEDGWPQLLLSFVVALLTAFLGPLGVLIGFVLQLAFAANQAGGLDNLSGNQFAAILGKSLLSAAFVGLGDLAEAGSTIAGTMNILGSTGGSAYSLITGLSPGSKMKYDEAATSPWTLSGYLHDPTSYEDYIDTNPLYSEGGQPDIWGVSGGSASGKMIIVNGGFCSGSISGSFCDEYGDGSCAPSASPFCETGGPYACEEPCTHYSCLPTVSCSDLSVSDCGTVDGCSVDARHTGNIDSAQFLLENTPAVNNAKIEFKKRSAFCAHENISCDDQRIGQFIVTSSDGTKYVYGDPTIKGSLAHVYGDGSYSHYADSGDGWETDTWIVQQIKQPYAYEWNLIAILSPDYVDGNSDLNPLNSEASNKGAWVAFNYDLKFEKISSLGLLGGNCGYGFGSLRDGVPATRENNWLTKSGGVKDISYLKEIITPTHKAVFYTSSRLDGLEADSWNFMTGDVMSGTAYMHSPWGDAVCNFFGCYSCTTTANDNLYKLDSIQLQNRASGVTIKQVKFNNGVLETDDSNGQYALKPFTKGGYGNSKKSYTLQKVDICAGNGVCSLNPFTFEYDNFDPVIVNSNAVGACDGTATASCESNSFGCDYDVPSVCTETNCREEPYYDGTTTVCDCSLTVTNCELLSNAECLQVSGCYCDGSDPDCGIYDQSHNNYDAFGFYYAYGTALEHNSPTSTQNKFTEPGTEGASIGTLQKVNWPAGATSEWTFEVDEWFTSRGDALRPFAGIYKNYYAYIRHKDEADISKSEMCESNYGGGLRVTDMTDCDGLGNCITTYYDYTMYDEDLDCTRTSGSISLVPSMVSSNVNDADLRRPAHMGGPYVSGGVLYNEVKTWVGEDNGYVIYNYLTIDSALENTGGAIDEYAMDYSYVDARI